VVATHMRRLAPLALTSALAALALILPATSSATALPGANGKIVFASGRANSDVPAPMDGNDNSARLWVADWPSGTPVQLTTGPVGVQHRHPSWSPDHTKVVYAAGTPFTGPFELRIVDLVAHTDTLFVAATAGQDRPTFSPDGTKVAYGNGSGVAVKAIAPGSTPQQITNVATDQRAVWSPDGNTLYFNRGSAGNRDLMKVTPVAPGGTVTPVLDAGTDDWQPALSPDGSRLCFLRGPQSDAADLFTIGVDGANEGPLATTTGVGDLNCIWSPDGTRILYTQGAFGAGELAVRNPFGGDLTVLSGFNLANHFDGNADWATNLSPVCDNKSASIGVNQFTVIQLGCADPDHTDSTIAPPTRVPIERDGVTVNKPARGNLGGLAEDLKIVYTPPKDFKGTDTFTYSGNDGTSEGRPATVTINVGTGGGGPGTAAKPASISRIKLSAKRFRRGPRLPTISKVKVGTTISFNLDTAANVTLSFQKKTIGRRAGRRCVKVTPRNRSKRACTRFVSKGSTPSLLGKVGVNRVRFQGRLTRSKRLSLGTYRVVVNTSNAAGRTKRNGPTFTIVG
jgi:Bacterial Ig domain/WD40-like Beta Propeller Repeat